MGTISRAQQVWAYFLLDRTEEMGSRLDLIERQLNGLLERFEHDDKTRSRVQSFVISMGAATCQVIERSRSNRFQLPRSQPGCDLGEALRQLEGSLSAVDRDGEHRVEVFVLLRSEPAGDWRSRIETLKRREKARVTVFAFAGEKEIRTETLRAIRTWPEGARRLEQFTSPITTGAFEQIFALLREAVEAPPIPMAQAVASPARPSSQGATGRVEVQSTGKADQAEQVSAELAAGVEGGSGGQKAEETAVAQAVAGDMREEVPDEAIPEAGAEAAGEEVAPPIEAGPPPVDEGGVATIWKELEPPAELGDRVPNTDARVLDAPGDWRMVGASRRGKMHAHKGIFREDAFALSEVKGWHLMVVADGGGSCPLSRVGSQLAADTAVKTMGRYVEAMSAADLSVEEVCELALRRGLERAWEALQTEADKRQVPLGHLGTTFLGVMHRPDEKGGIVGVLQVGDGLVAAEFADGKVVALAEPDVGETAGVTFFLTSKHWKEWLDRVNVVTLGAPLRLLAAMCDGVADDFIPFDPHLRRLFEHLGQVIKQKEPDKALLDLLGYKQRGSFDDRTLMLIYRVQSGPEREAKPAAGSESKEARPAPGSPSDASEERPASLESDPSSPADTSDAPAPVTPEAAVEDGGSSAT